MQTQTQSISSKKPSASSRKDVESFDYSPALEKADHVTIQPQYGLFINGKFTPAKNNCLKQL